MPEQQPYRFINDAIKIDFEVPLEIKEFMALAEKYDREDNVAMYMSYAANIDIVAKHCFMAEMLSERQWDLLCARYKQ